MNMRAIKWIYSVFCFCFFVTTASAQGTGFIDTSVSDVDYDSQQRMFVVDVCVQAPLGIQVEINLSLRIDEYNQTIEKSLNQSDGCQEYFFPLDDTAIEDTGGYTIIAYVDPYDTLEEIDEDNNTYASYLRVVFPFIQQTEQLVIDRYPLLSSLCVVGEENIISECPVYQSLFTKINQVIISSLLEYTSIYTDGGVSQESLLAHIRSIQDGLVALDNRISSSWRMQGSDVQEVDMDRKTFMFSYMGYLLDIYVFYLVNDSLDIFISGTPPI